MKVAFITRSTLYAVPGGDTEQILQTARFLKELGVEVDLFLTTEKIDYAQYDLLHVFNITRPADILFHITRTNKPVVVSTILVDYTEFDMQHRKGLPGKFLRLFPASANEYIKTIARWILKKDSLQSTSYLWKGQRKSIKEILQKASILLPNSVAEYQKIEELYGIKKKYSVVHNGIDQSLFSHFPGIKRDSKLVLSAARIEGRKNQLNLIKALNDSEYTLMLTGLPAPNQKKYYDECKSVASKNIIFCGRVPVNVLLDYYRKAKVHVLPSWHETCGLSSLEAAAMGCNIVITEKGFTREYFGDDAFYCDPGSPESIFNAVENAAQGDCRTALQQKILHQYTWQQAAASTLTAYQNSLSLCKN
ncbi:MAG: glycosyltransferase family 4 protein [Chitinophagaceae bacterium]